MKNLVLILAVIIVVLLGVFFFYNPAHSPTVSPGKSATMSSDGKLAITSLHDGDTVTSPITITGTVTGGGWFNGATFPVTIADGDGRIIGQGVAQARADWMSTSSVPFTAIINFTAPRYASGTVVLSKDNPSGASASAASLSILVLFK